MKNKRKYPSRQVRRNAERRRAKRLAEKEQAQKGNQDRSDTQESDKPKRKIDWKSTTGVIGVLVKAAEFIRDTFF